MFNSKNFPEGLKPKTTRYIGLAIGSISIVYYFTVLITYQVNAPHQDDYDTVLIYMNEIVKMDSFIDQIWWSVKLMSNEHIVLLNHLISWMQYAITGSINFNLLTFVGSLIVLITWIYFIGISREVLVNHTNNSSEIILALLTITTSLLFFNLSYYDSTFRATSLMQKIGIVLVAMLAISAFFNGKNGIACFYAICGIFINGNGLFIPISILTLCLLTKEKREAKNLIIWTAVSISVFLIYKSVASFSPRSYNYVDVLSYASILRMLHHYFSFCGSIFELVSHNKALTAGLIVNSIFFISWITNRNKQNLVVIGIILFLMLSFLATSYGRAEEGYAQAFSSRYKLYAGIYLSFNILLMLSSFQRVRLITATTILFIILFTVPEYHSWNIDKIAQRKDDLLSSINSFRFSEDDSVELQYAPSQKIPRDALKESAILGVYTNNHIKSLIDDQLQNED